MRSSDKGAPELSPPTRWRMRERTDSDDTTTPGVRAGSEEVKNKAAGINVNLWTGLGMLVFGALMIYWALARPVAPEPKTRRSPAA